MMDIIPGKMIEADNLKVINGTYNTIDTYFHVGEGRYQQYFELKVNKGRVEFYWQDEEDSLSFQFGGVKKELVISGYEMSSEYSFEDYLQILEREFIKKQDEVLDLGITKLSNGYMFKNTYYETLEEILEGEKE